MSATSGNGSSPVDLMRYDLLTQAALRQVVRLALARVEREGGLPGNHHFFISFDVRHPEVSISERLREKYPEEMTIVIQHQFWGLHVHGDHFEVNLSFGGQPEQLVIPFEAVKSFFDPAVQFGMQFEVARPEEEEGGETEGGATNAPEAAAAAGGEAPAPRPEATEETREKAAGEDSPKVVSLDQFRKK